MEYTHIKISIKEAEQLLQEHYGITGTASPLAGEIDFNFKIAINDQDRYILKISRPDASEPYLEFQQDLLVHIASKASTITAPKVINNIEGQSIASYTDSLGHSRKIRLLTWVPGRLWSDVNPQNNALRYGLGYHCGRLTNLLSDFKHPEAERTFEWDTAQALWTKQYVDLFEGEALEIITYFQTLFETQKPAYDALRKSCIHNDANDNNIIVSADLVNPEVITTIDYGDAIHSQIINDLAVACAYAIMHHNDPLDAALPIVKGFHKAYPLQADELKHLYTAIAMRLIISVTKSAINKTKEPDNTYLLISEKPAWQLLKKWYKIAPSFAYYSFRNACGFDAHPLEASFKNWAKHQEFSLEDIFPTIKRSQAIDLDLSVSSTWVGHQNDFNNLPYFQYKIEALQAEHPQKIIAGGYLEPRALYTATSYDTVGNYGKESRSIHLGVDFWLPAYTPVHALLDGEVVTAVNDAGDKEYGGLVILKHQQNNLTFYTLYGHNTVASATQHKVGDLIKKGDQIAVLANYPENGNWAPHLHFQILLSMLNYDIDFPGVAYHRQMDVWKSVCPDPNLLFKLPELRPKSTPSNDTLITYRKEHLGKGLSLQYKVPIKMVRGAGAYLVDQYGKHYLDTVNNVAHVGHEHPRVVKAGQEQMALINTNSRYLHENINALAQELIDTLPPELNVLHFVNSGSEANELALRMVKTVTGEQDIIASEVGYHGNTNGCIAISSYKFDGKGGSGAPEHTHIFPLPDKFRGKYRGENTGTAYANEVQNCITQIHAKKRGVAAFIIEPIISCGGQIELPDGFLKQAYDHVRNAGGLCISDEVQVGCGRVGKSFWGFELHDVTPDIVTIGKPLGNGHPLAAVACTQAVANAFANGMEYFNTFGGNPVSCAIGTEVLRTVKREKLQENALEVGHYLKSTLQDLAQQFPIIANVRGQGLFLGFELTNAALAPLPMHTSYLANRMKEHGILMSIDGPDHNVLKIKPPMVFNKDHANELIHYLEKILNEDLMQQF